MPSILIEGPAVPTGTHNVVLRDAVLHSPLDRTTSSVNYAKVEVGLSSGRFVTWIGAWSQASQKAEAGTVYSILDVGRKDTRVRSGQILLVRVTTAGTPESLVGCRVGFTLSLVGNRDGDPKPLVASGALIGDSAARSAVVTLENQINVGGLAEWEEAVELVDPVPLVKAGTFDGRLQRDSTTQLSLQRYTGNWIEVDGNAVSLGSSGLSLTTSDGLLSAAGGVTSTAPSTSTLYYVYVGAPPDGASQLRLCATAPSRLNGVYYLGADEMTRRWRFVGWARTNGSTQFTDDTTDRLVVNFYNRRASSILLTPGYADDDAETSYTTTSTTFVAANGGTGATGSYIANGEDAVDFSLPVYANTSAGGALVGIGDDSATAAYASVICATRTTGCVRMCKVPSSGYHTVVVVIAAISGTTTVYADSIRSGSATDPYRTYLTGVVMT